MFKHLSRPGMTPVPNFSPFAIFALSFVVTSTPLFAAPSESEMPAAPTAVTEPLVVTTEIPVTDAAATSPETTTPSPGSSTPAATGVAKGGLPQPAQQPARLYAPRIYYDRGTIVAQGDMQTPVRLEGNGVRIMAQKVLLDTVNHTVNAEGTVRVEREVRVRRFSAERPQSIRGSRTNKEAIVETLEGNNFSYNYATQQGTLGATRLRLQNFNISAQELIINGQRYIARHVVVRPGGLSDKELKIYGTPPLNLRAKEVVVDNSRPAPAAVNNTDTSKSDSSANPSTLGGPRTSVRNAWLYYKNTKLFPVPSALLSRNLSQREQSTYQITPRIYFNSQDGVLVTTRLQAPLNRQKPGALDLTADVGLSSRVGFRGGLSVDSDSRLGSLGVSARINDVISSQLTSRIELDRLPEIQYRPPALPLFELPGARRAGLRFAFVGGSYRESYTDENRSVNDSRLQAQVRFTTRLARDTGPYLDLFAREALYSRHPENLSTQGFEVGYTGHFSKWIYGQFSFSAQNIGGSTPFRFDAVEIRRELRSTFDVQLTPRYLIPIDLRYDLDRKTFRDKSIGLLRNYKTFAYGLTYQSSRNELRLELRQGF